MADFFGRQGSNLFKDAIDSGLAAITGQRPTWQIQADIDAAKANAKATQDAIDKRKAQAAQNQENPNGTSSAGSSGYSAPQRDLAAEAFYQSGIDQTNNLIGGLGGRENTALQSLMQSYNNTRAKQDVARADNESDYNKQSDRLIRENAQRKSQIDNNVRGNITALQRLLGARGAGSSSASQLVVPQAAAAQGTAQRADATQTFVDNKDATDTNWNRYKREWDQARLDTDADYENNQKDIRSQFAQEGINARQKLQELLTNLSAAKGGDNNAINSAKSVTNTINDLQNKIAELSQRSQSRVISANDPTYQAAATKAMSNETTSTAQNSTQDPNYDATASYYGDVKDLSDEELLKHLYTA
ncbi:MAG TPA: hypothetical protein VJ841_03615 [Candidatus Saccharimonadales bacterium]|nr:hypothetical protein [Candidatus Saccharimonadales bacterium]